MRKGFGAPRGAFQPCSGAKPLPLARRSGLKEAEGNPNPGTRVRLKAALTTTGRTSTVRWSGSGKQDRKAYVRNQRYKAPKVAHQLQSDGYGLESSACPCFDVRITPWSVRNVDREATVKVCGVAVAMLQEHSWVPTLSSGWRVNVGIIPAAPAPVRLWQAGGKARCQLMQPEWGGGPVVVRGRESRLRAPLLGAGEGVQHARSIHADRGGRR